MTSTSTSTTTSKHVTGATTTNTSTTTVTTITTTTTSTTNTSMTSTSTTATTDKPATHYIDFNYNNCASHPQMSARGHQPNRSIVGESQGALCRWHCQQPFRRPLRRLWPERCRGLWHTGSAQQIWR